MVWARLDDRANNNAKLLKLTDAGWRLWGCALIYCQDNLTDGFVDESAITTFGVKGSVRKAAEELCRAIVPGKKPLWHKVEGGYRVNDFHDWNDTAESVLRKRENGKKRIDKLRAAAAAARNAVHGALQLVNVTGKNGVGNAHPYPRTEKEQERTAPPALRDCGNPVDNRKPATTWKRAVAIAHRVMDENVDRRDWSEAFKALCAEQRIDYGALNDAGRPLYARALEYVEGARARRSA